jgi:hypothetical protein
MAYRILLSMFFVLCTAVALAQPAGEFPMLDRPWPQSGDKFSFVVLGDKTSGGEGKWPIYDRAVDMINRLRPDFVVTVGDMIPGHMEDRVFWDEEWAEYWEHAERFEVPVFFTPGNHDIANDSCYQWWKEDLGPTYYSFDHQRCHFLVLNTEEERIDGRGPVWQEMMQFAEVDLDAHTDARHTFVFFHKPMWDDPRYEDDWARIEKALGDRPHTVVAGHEHYHATEQRGSGFYVIQSATGGGLDLSPVKQYGAFHSFGYVTVDGDKVTYSVVEVHPDGNIWPADIAPASFRKAIAYEVVKLNALTWEELGRNRLRVRPVLRLANPLEKPVKVEVTLNALDDSGWKAEAGTESITTVELVPGESQDRPLSFLMDESARWSPPYATWRVQYEGASLENEAFPMVQENVLPIAPVAWRVVPEWQVAGPFPLGAIDTEKLPADPAAANGKFLDVLGPTGSDPGPDFQAGQIWWPAESQGRGLLNFNALLGTEDQAAGYAKCSIHTDAPLLTWALVYSDNYHLGILNGELIKEGQDFGAPGGFTYVPLRLQAGWNTFMVKLINNRGDWLLRVLVHDPENTLRFSAIDEPVN